MKECSKCGEKKPLREFHKNKAMSDGLHFYCKSCHRAYAQARRRQARERLADARDVDGFVRAVAAAMEARGMSGVSLAAELGCKHDTVYAWLRGEKSPSPVYQVAAANVLGIELNEPAFRQDDDGSYPDGMGECGVCGDVFPSYRKSFRKYCSSECATKAQSIRQFGEDNPAYKDGRKMTDGGYVQILLGKGHPMAARGGYALEHRYVMSEALGRPLKRTERVHHKNGIKTDNRIENLELWVPCGSRTEHPHGVRLIDKIIHMTESLKPDERQKLMNHLQTQKVAT